MRTRCPHCRSGFKVRDEHQGKNAKCPICGKHFVVREIPETTSSSSGVSGPTSRRTVRCANCEGDIPEEDRGIMFRGRPVCAKCYGRLIEQERPAVPGSVPQGTRVLCKGRIHAGFWLRCGAWAIDELILVVPYVVITTFLGLFVGLSQRMQGTEYVGWRPEYLVGFVACMFYKPIMESSSKQASLGKMVLGIIVTDTEGDRISFGKAIGRNLAKLISSICLGAGFIMAGFSEQKQALHDMMANCLVVRKP